MAGADEDSSPLHIVMFPWLAFGHVLPALELARRLASRGLRVSFASTPRIISRLPPVTPSLAPFLELVSLPALPHVDGLPEGCEATSDVPPGKADLHLQAFDALAAPFSAFLDTTKKVDWVIIDSFQYWAAAACRDRGIPCVLNLVYAAATSEQYGVPRGDAASSVAVSDLGPSIAQRFVRTFEACTLLAQRSCLELEPDSLPLLPGIFGKPVVPVGLLPPPSQDRHDDDDPTMSWLDKQAPGSVVYVTFGSEAPWTVEQLHEIALGLELAGTGFLLTMRKPPPPAAHNVSLPPGFEARTRGRGRVVTGWVPQLRILAHGAVGAFMTHCGWGSIIEGLAFGHPLIMLPFLGEHKINARLMEKKQIGVLVPRRDGSSFHRDGVAAAVRGVMCDDAGKVLAHNAKKLQEVVTDKECQDRYIDQFIQNLRSLP